MRSWAAWLGGVRSGGGPAAFIAEPAPTAVRSPQKAWSPSFVPTAPHAILPARRCRLAIVKPDTAPRITKWAKRLPRLKEAGLAG